MTGRVDPIGVALLVADALDRLGIEHTIGGSIASSFAGEPRSTVDIDVIAALTDAHVPSHERELDSSRIAVESGPVRGRRDPARPATVEAPEGGRRRAARMLPVHPPEDILLQKLRWYRKGGEVSDRQWRDILGIVRVQGRLLDREYLAANAPLLRVADLLSRALHEGTAG